MRQKRRSEGHEDEPLPTNAISAKYPGSAEEVCISVLCGMIGAWCY